MKYYAPDYYKDFKCIASMCKHSCCIGWEIDIDNDTFEYYSSQKGELGKKLRESISCGKDTHFILSKDNRCPFLNSSNLCDIYTELGEGALCQICTDHPRYRNFFDSRVEIGLGMCCEAAAKLILQRCEKMILEIVDADEEEEEYNEEEKVFFNIREEVFDILQDRSMSIDARVDKLKDKFHIKIPNLTLDEWIDIYLDLEILDEEWRTFLENSKGMNISIKGEEDDNTYEQLVVYFVLRHMNQVGMTNIERILTFCIHCFYMVRGLVIAGRNLNGYTLEDVARMYSSEIEYSTDNMDNIIFEIESSF